MQYAVSLGGGARGQKLQNKLSLILVDFIRYNYLSPRSISCIGNPVYLNVNGNPAKQTIGNYPPSLPSSHSTAAGKAMVYRKKTQSCIVQNDLNTQNVNKLVVIMSRELCKAYSRTTIDGIVTRVAKITKAQ